MSTATEGEKKEAPKEKMTKRDRVERTFRHEEADRVPLDLGATPVSGMQVNTVYALRQALKLDAPGTPVRVTEPYQMLGEIADDLADALGVDCAQISAPKNMFGFRNEGPWKPFTCADGTPALVPALFNTEPDPATGDLLQFPEGDRAVPPSAKMPRGGFYFDAIARQRPIVEAELRVEDNLEEFEAVSDETLRHYADESKRLFERTDRALVVCFGGLAFGDIALVPATWLKDPKGIRGVSEWYESLASRKSHVRKIFERQAEISLANLDKLASVVGDRACAIMVSGTDFGAQNGPLISPRLYRDLFQPFHAKLNSFIHSRTHWRTFIHSCGSSRAFYSDFLDAGFDILNPVQTNAAKMDPTELKAQFGKRATFWGGGVCTQKTLPFGTPEEVAAQVHQRLLTFGAGGGFVFNPVHNIQARVPVENVLAMYKSFHDHCAYPLK